MATVVVNVHYGKQDRKRSSYSSSRSSYGYSGQSASSIPKKLSQSYLKSVAMSCCGSTVSFVSISGMTVSVKITVGGTSYEKQRVLEDYANSLKSSLYGYDVSSVRVRSVN